MAPKNFLSEERVQDSSDDESMSSEAQPVPAPKVNGAPKPTKKKSTLAAAPIDKTSSDESDESSNESDATSASSNSSRGSKRKANDSAKQPLQSPSKKSKNSISNVKRIESSTYYPPEGYTSIKKPSTESISQVSTIFNDLEGKQLWQISAPSSFPISKLESLDVQAALNGETILQHKGISYTMNIAETDRAALLLPKPNGDYAAATGPITQAFNVVGKSDTSIVSEKLAGDSVAVSQGSQQQRSDHSQLHENTFFATKLGQKKPPRQQPENLKARYVPFGVIVDATNSHENGVIDHDDTVMADATDEPVEAVETQSQVKSNKTPKKSSKVVDEDKSLQVIDEESTPRKKTKEKKHSIKSSSSQENTLKEQDPSQKKKKKRKEQSEG